MYMKLLLVCVFCNLFELTFSLENHFTISEISFNYNFTETGINFEILKNETKLLSGILNSGQNSTGINCDFPSGNCTFGDYVLAIHKIEDGIHLTWETNNLQRRFNDCFEFGEAHWYGGPENNAQKWPLENMHINGDHPYVLRKTEHFSVAERYWLSSKGLYIYLDEKVPLFVDQNTHVHGGVCFTARLDGPYIGRSRNILEYKVIFKDNPREAHLHAINNYLGKPTGHPNEKIIREPIWSTWAKYKSNINDDIVLTFSKQIRSQGYEGGQIEIDDRWETCYGAQEFSTQKFPNIKNTVATLKAQDFRVSLWVHPFVSPDCQNNSDEGIAKDYFVKNTSDSISGSWWHGETYQIDFTKAEAAEWFSARLKKLQTEIGIDSFKFDAGETEWGPQPSVYKNVDPERVPNIISERYVRTCATFGDLIEIRSPFRTQDLPVLVRMIDKTSVWGQGNGLYTLITTLLQMNINGYPMVLPDMIGGNGYSGNTPDAELLVRWTQANTFMPTMQFSYLPWDITSDDFDSAAIVKKFINLHANFSTEILDAMYMSINYGWPVNPPVWWVDPTNEDALKCDDEFLVGDSILVAPVIEQGARTRTIFLPSGQWVDGNNGTTYNGPRLVKDYPAPIDVLPYFLRIK